MARSLLTVVEAQYLPRAYFSLDFYQNLLYNICQLKMIDD